MLPKAQEKQVKPTNVWKDSPQIALFDVTGGGFEMMKARAATFVSNSSNKDY